MSRCQNTEALRDFDFAQSMIRPIGETASKRELVVDLARDLIQGLDVTILRWGRKYTRDDLMTDVFEHELYDGAFFAAYAKDFEPLRDLTIRCAQYAVCEYLYPSEAEALGFSK